MDYINKISTLRDKLMEDNPKLTFVMAESVAIAIINGKKVEYTPLKFKLE